MLLILKDMKKNYNIADDEWEWYIGKLFGRLIEKLYHDKIKNVIEIAPGFRYKIAYALKDNNFKGTIYIIDSSLDVLNYVKEKYQELLPEAKIVCINKTFKESINLLPRNIDLLLANHVLDDMIISKYKAWKYNRSSNNEVMFNELSNLWKELADNIDEVNRITLEIFNEFKELFNTKTIKFILMSQYKSNSYYLNNKDMDNIIDKLFNMIKELSNTDNRLINNILDYYPFGKDDERYNGKYLLDNTQNAKNWIAGEVK
jgi:hypothetical protein